MTSEEKLVGSAEAAKFLNMHQQTVNEYCRRGIIKGIKRDKQNLIAWSEVEKYQNRRARGLTIREIQSEIARGL